MKNSGIALSQTWSLQHAKSKRKLHWAVTSFHRVFVDLTNAFDTVNKKALWLILGKIGCPQHFVNLVKSFHENMEAWVDASVAHFVWQVMSLWNAGLCNYLQSHVDVSSTEYNNFIINSEPFTGRSLAKSVKATQVLDIFRACKNWPHVQPRHQRNRTELVCCVCGEKWMSLTGLNVNPTVDTRFSIGSVLSCWQWSWSSDD